MNRKSIDEALGKGFRNIQQHSPLNSQSKFIEGVIYHEYLLRAVDGVVEVSHPRLREIAGITPNTARSITDAMAESGRWEIVRGIGHRTTTYKPLFFTRTKANAEKDD